jgi:transposase
LVLKSRFTISKAASKLRIALSTAKLIVKRYKESGTYFLRHEEKKRFKKMLGYKKNVEEYRPPAIPVEFTSENQNLQGEIEPEGQTATTDAIYAPFFYYFQSFPNF